MELFKFVNSTLSHIANEHKVSKNVVQMDYDMWKVATEEDSSARSQLHNKYVEEYETPRNAYMLQHASYSEEHMNAKNKWLMNKQNRSALMDVINTHPSKELVYGYNNCSQIYTQYSLPNTQ